MADSRRRSRRLSARSRRELGSLGLPALFTSGVALLYLLGLPEGCAGPRYNKAVVSGQAHLTVVGHTWRPQQDEPDDSRIRVGTSPTAELRLTESGIPVSLGEIVLEPEPDELTWVHGSTTRTAAFLGMESGWSGATATARGMAPLVRLDQDSCADPATDDCPATTVLWTERAIAPDDDGEVPELAGACGEDEPPEGVQRFRIRLHDSVGLWLPDDSGSNRTLELPRLAGSTKNLGEGQMFYDGHHLWLLPDEQGPCELDDPTQACLEEKRQQARRDGVLVTRAWSRMWARLPTSQGSSHVGEAASRTLDEDIFTSLGLEERFHAPFQLAQAPNLLFIKPRAYMSVDGGRPEPIGVAGDPGLHDRPFSVLRRRRGQAESSAPIVRWLGAWLSDAKRAPLVGRSGRATSSEGLYLCQEGSALPLGSQALRSGDILIAGNGHHYQLERHEDGSVQAMLTLPLDGRVNLIPSLSAGRLLSQNSRISVGACERTRL
ncbi:MAG: hypothetical protein QGG40_02425, partial [Myxococcota bacterium]|nr:hypothetical protein [Myxococcota bacterium]